MNAFEIALKQGNEIKKAFTLRARIIFIIKTLVRNVK